jgi:hypothetical protein
MILNAGNGKFIGGLLFMASYQMIYNEVSASGSEFVAVFIYLVKIPNMVCWLHRGKINQ